MEKIYVGNLSANTTQQQLTTFFTDYGVVSSVTMHIDKHFAFIEMDTIKKALSAEGKEINGNKIHVSDASTPRRPRGPYTN